MLSCPLPCRQRGSYAKIQPWGLPAFTGGLLGLVERSNARRGRLHVRWRLHVSEVTAAAVRGPGATLEPAGGDQPNGAPRSLTEAHSGAGRTHESPTIVTRSVGPMRHNAVTGYCLSPGGAPRPCQVFHHLAGPLSYLMRLMAAVCP